MVQPRFGMRSLGGLTQTYGFCAMVSWRFEVGRDTVANESGFVMRLRAVDNQVYDL